MFKCVNVCVSAVFLSFAAIASAGERSELQDYIDRPDDSYSYTVRQHLMMGDIEAYELTMTSQTWHGIPWLHRVFIIKPGALTSPKQSMLVIGGGNWREEYTRPLKDGENQLPGEAKLFAEIARRAGSVAVVLLNVPQQPIFEGRKEDAAIAYTFDKYLNTQESDWPLLLPMTKSAVRAMDTAQAFASEKWNIELENFTVTGASKRGWTTWLTGAMDARVNAIAPMVIDMLNLDPQMHHQVESWGEFSAMIHDYTDLNIIERLQEPAGQVLREIVDPYAYREKLTMPKLVVLGTNDPYWPVDALNHYWDGLVGDKRILYIPNAGHGLEAGFAQVINGVLAAHKAAAGEIELANIDWKFEEDGDALLIHVTSDQQPKLAQAWSAFTASRDFRPSPWTSQTVIAKDGVYTYRLPRPQEGHAALFMGLMFESDEQVYNLSTQIQVLPGKTTQAAKAE